MINPANLRPKKGVPVLKTFFKKHRLTIHHILPGLSLACTLFVFAPVDLFLSSAEEFWFSLTDLSRWLGILALASFVLITLLAWLLPRKLSVAFRAVIYAVSFLAWIQGNLLMIQYGTLDGSLIDWSAYTLPYVLDALLWVTVICLFVFLMFRFRKKFRRIVEIAACVLMITQLASLAVFLIRENGREKEEYLYLSRDGQFTVSSAENTIVFVPDTVDSLFFNEFIEQYPDEIKEALADFTYYRDTVGGAARTQYAIPQILTGDVNRQDVPYRDYLKAGYAASPLMNELASGQYDTGFYTYERYLDLSRKDAIGNVAVGNPKPSSRAGLTKQFLKLVAFRYAPSVFSRYFWFYTGDFDVWKDSNEYTPNDASFYKKLKAKGLQISTDKPAFRFLHLRGLHPPFRLDENLKKVGSGNTNESRQCLGLVKLFADYMAQLKKLGVYDQSTVIIMADHGSYKHSSDGQAPILMVKFADASHPFEISDIPLSYFSMQEIVISALRGELTSLEPWQSEGPRYFYRRSEKTNTVSLTEYVIDGPVYEAPAIETGVVFHDGTLKANRDYAPGTTVYFDYRDTARPYLVSGIPNNEGALAVWTVGNDVQMRFDLPEIPGTLRLTLEYANTYRGPQTVEVWVNDQLIDSDVVEGVSRQTVLIPAGTVTGTELRLHLHLPDAVSPSSFGTSKDNRLLALNMESLTIENVSDEE